MALVIVDEGLDELLKRALGTNATGDLLVHLYTNSHTPVGNDTIADYTEPGLGTGYGAVNVPIADWAYGINIHVETALQPPITFTFSSGPVTVEGYFVTDLSGSTLLWAEQAAAPISIPGGGGTLDVSLKLQFKNC